MEEEKNTNPAEYNQTLDTNTQAPEPTPQSTEPIQPVEKKTSFLLPTVIGLLVLGLMAGSIYYFYFRANEAPIEENNIATPSTPKAPTITECAGLPEKLEACEAFSCEFKHPLTGEMMTREIIGLKDGKCEYTEEMPNGGKMECMFTEDSRKSVAELHRNPSSEGTKNPLQEATNNGECVISGYGEEQVAPTETTPDEPDDRFTVNWGEFQKDSQDKYWELEAELSNQEEKMIVIQHAAIKKGANLYYGEGVDLLRPPIKKEPILFRVRTAKATDEISEPEKIMLSILAYECEKLPNETKLCDESYGMVTQDDTLKERKKAGDPIKPTRTINKYFEFYANGEPPTEITEEEYNQTN